MRNVWSAPSSFTYQGNNQPLYVQTTNTIKTGFFGQQYSLLMEHQQEDAVDGGAAGTTQFHFLLDSELNNNGANVVSPFFVFDANEGAAGTANYQLGRRTRTTASIRRR